MQDMVGRSDFCKQFKMQKCLFSVKDFRKHSDEILTFPLTLQYVEKVGSVKGRECEVLDEASMMGDCP